MENKIIELRNWFRMNGEMDFERSGKKEDTGKFITYKCADIESIFASALANDHTSEKDLRVCEVSVSLLDFYAAEAMKAEIISWNAEMSDSHRSKLLEDMINRFGQTTVYEALSKNSFEMAEVMVKERCNGR